MSHVLDWNRNRDMWIRVLGKQTGESLDYWNKLVRKEKFKDEKSLRVWLKKHDPTGFWRDYDDHGWAGPQSFSQCRWLRCRLRGD